MAGKTEYKYAWAKAHLVHITLDVPPELKAAAQSSAAASGQSLRAYIMQAVEDRMAREGFKLDPPADQPKDDK